MQFSPRAIAVNIEIMRTFVRVRALAATHGDLAKRLAELEEKTEALAMNHDTFSHNTRAQLKKALCHFVWNAPVNRRALRR